ncbi:MAG: IMPACT family protein [Thermoanaerobaculia bacterium]
MSAGGSTGEGAGPERPGYRVPAGESVAELRERGSRFLAVIRPAPSGEAARGTLDALAAEHGDATHLCWASRAGWPPLERSSDAGEPSGTAGVPILQVLRGAGLSDVVAVVVRWFGGTKLGKGGLARAYAAAAREAVDALAVARRVPTAELALELPYEALGAVKRLVRPPQVTLRDEEYTDVVRLTLAVHEPEREALEAALADLGVTPLEERPRSR